MTTRLRTLDGYVLRSWLRVFLITLLGFPLLVIVIDLTDNLDKYLSRGIGKGAVALSYVFGIPETMFLVLPAAVLFATVFTVSVMGRHSEITAAKAGGISFHRLVRPLLLASGAAFGLGLVLGEVIPVAATRKAALLGENDIRSGDFRYNFVYRADGGWVYAIRTVQLATAEMQDVILERAGTGAEYPTIVVVARRGRWAESTRRWTLEDGAVRFLAGPGRELAFRFDTMRTLILRERPADLLARPKSPEEMRYAELGRYIDALERSGADAKKLAVERALKISVPFACIIIALFGAPLAMTGPRSGVAYGLAVALGTTFVDLLLFQLSRAVGAGGVLPPTLAAWVPNLVFGGAAVWLLRKVRT
ncbi:MAG TPA: LptF/LptG family permease [Gemmatimonadales bacterium]|nr:LptF/LptG family permease [Gemmatimonadales bacterium]